MKKWMTVEEFLRDLPHIPAGSRRCEKVVMHHTAEPTHASWRGDRSADGILSYWRSRSQQLGYRNPLGAHFIVAPGGEVYQAFPLEQVLNANSNSGVNLRSVSFETVGNFDVGHDRLEGVQRHAVMGLIGGLLVRYSLQPDDLFFHRDFTKVKSCPGTGIERAVIRESAIGARRWAEGVMDLTPPPPSRRG